jgi:fatty acid desaturase
MTTYAEQLEEISRRHKKLGVDAAFWFLTMLYATLIVLAFVESAWWLLFVASPFSLGVLLVDAYSEPMIYGWQEAQRRMEARAAAGVE